MLGLDGPDGAWRMLGPLHRYPAGMSRCTALSVSGSFAIASFFSMNEGHFVLIDLENGLFAPAFDPPNAALLESGLTDSEWGLAELAKLDVRSLPPDR